MSVTQTSFIAAFPEFATYSPATINEWIGFAGSELSLVALGSTADLATMLYVAHNLVLGARDAATVASGGIPGDIYGPVSSKSVGGVSVSYDDASTADPKGRSWNATTYGQRLFRLLKAARLGGLYITGRC